MKNLNMHHVIEKLKEKRVVFHSEADFQFALAWQIKEIYQEKVQLSFELPLGTEKRDRLDILVTFGSKKTPIELKYFHSELTYKEYKLSKQNDTWRSYRVLKDLVRVEKYVKKNPSKSEREGYVLLICNEEKYWTPKRDNLTYYDFRLEDGRNIKANNQLDWITVNDLSQKNASKYGEPLTFRNDYVLSWKDYSVLDIPKKNQFKYLIIEVTE